MFFSKFGHRGIHRKLKAGAQTDAPASRFALLDHYLPSQAQTFTASTSILILISFPTVSPPVSSRRFQTSPKSLRSSLPVALNPILSPPHGSFCCPSNRTSKVIGLVTSLIVKSPVSLNSSRSPSIPVLRNVISG